MHSLLIPDKHRGFSSRQTSLPMKDTRPAPVRKRGPSSSVHRMRKPVRNSRARRGFTPAQKAMRAFNAALLVGVGGIGVFHALNDTLNIAVGVLVGATFLVGGWILITDTP